MTLLQKIGIAILVVIFILLIVLAPKESQKPLTKFQRDLMEFGVERKMAEHIDLYFEGKREYLTWDEAQELLRVYNLVMEESGKRDFSDVTGIDDVINKLNLLIQEMALIRQNSQ